MTETEYTEKETHTRRGRIGWIIAAILLAELLLAGAMIRRQQAEETRIEQHAAAVETALAKEPPQPLTLAETLGVSASDWELTLVRSDAPLSPDFVPVLEEVEEGEMFDARAASALRVMLAEARADGYEVYLCSAYRSYEIQKSIYDRHIESYLQQGMTPEEALAATLLSVNLPGGSEHQLGLAADILESRDQEMESWIGGSGLMLWLEEHCAEYGFIVRYPAGKTAVTGVAYEPWHLRYVGSCAPYIMENGLCLEEFLEQLS